MTGLFVVIALPPFRGLDEASHIYRITQLSEGDLLIEKNSQGYGHDIPNYLHNVNMYEFTRGERSVFFDALRNRVANGHYVDPQNNSPQAFEGSGSYSPMTYIHLVPVGVLARALHTNAYTYTLLLRIANLALFIVAAYFAIRFVTFGKWFLVAICLLPMSIHQAGTVSGDVILMSSVLLFVAALSNVITNKIKNKKRLMYCLFGISILLAVGKPGYFLLLLPVLFLPKDRFINRGGKRAFVLLLFTVSALLILSWNYVLAKEGLSGALETFRARANGGSLYSHNELINLVLYPIRIFGIYVNTFVRDIYHSLPNIIGPNYNESSDFIFTNFTGQYGSLGIHAPIWTSVLVVINLVVAFLAFGSKKLSQKIRLSAIAAIVMQVAAISLLFLVTWTPSHVDRIRGLQGRYLIPLLPLLILLLPQRSAFTWSERKSKIIIATFSIIPLFMMCDLIFETFYKGIL